MTSACSFVALRGSVKHCVPASTAMALASSPDRAQSDNVCVSPTCATRGRVLTCTLRSTRSPKGSVATRKGASAPSALAQGRKLASRLRSEFADALDDGSLRFVSVCLTCGSGRESDMRLRLAEYMALLARRMPRGGACFALDVSKKGRFHAHGIVLVPVTLNRNKGPGRARRRLKRWWLRLAWSGASAAPALAGQYVREIRSDRRLATKLTTFLAHHFGRTRRRAFISGLPGLRERVFACGALTSIETLVTGERPPTLHAPAAARPTASLRARKASNGTQARLALCAWCQEPLGPGRKDRKVCGPSCRTMMSSALVSFADMFGADARAAVELQMRGSRACRSAMRAVEAALPKAVSMASSPVGFPVADVRCACGAEIPEHLRAKGCGRSACRVARWRKRHPWTPKVTEPQFVGVLSRRFGDKAFMLGEATAAASDVGFDRRRVRDLLRDLAEADGVLDVDDGGSFRFAPFDRKATAP